ncbi:hypothetical protein CL619_04530 [archaeon]|nr:hypothetical protein [archaeon]
MKRGQITIFIVIGMIVLVAASLLFFTFSEEKKIQPQAKIISTSAITSLVEKCIGSTAQEGIFENSRQGGYFVLPEHSTTDLFEDIPYFVNLSKFPGDKVLANELGLYIDTLLDFCLDFTVFEKQGYNFSIDTPVSDVTLNQKEFRINTKLPIRIKLRTQTKELSSFRVKVPAKQFYQDITLARKILGSMEKEDVCLTCFANLANQNSVFVGILPIHNQTYIFDLKDNNYLIDKEFFHFKFGVKYERK